MIWDARTWLYQKQMIDDFVLFTMMNNLCIDNGVQMHFNLRQAFKSFVLEQSRPGLAMQIVADEQSGADEQKDRPLSVEKQYEQLRLVRMQNEKMMGPQVNNEWKYLYNSVAPIILQACIINDHFDKFL